MQPNLAETTNILMLELIKIVADPNAVHDIGSLSSSTGFSSPTVWMQTLLYASLSLSLLAAFGAVLGKQWLNSYKAARGRGSLQERGLQRQRKLDGLERWRLQTVLRSFLVFLQIAFLLFGLSLSANMWIQQRTISSVIICATALGILFYVATILVSVIHPDCPFQTAGSTLIGAICKDFSEFIKYRFSDLSYFFRNLSPHLSYFLENISIPGRFESTPTPDTYGKSSAMRWILETSTNPEVVEAAAEMVPRVQWPPKFDSSVVYARLADNFATCVIRSELSVTYGKAMAHLCIQSESIPFHLGELNVWRSWGERSRFIRDAFTDARLAYDQLSRSTEDRDAQRKHRADARTALRTVMVHGIQSQLSCPDAESVIWNGDFHWRHSNGNTPCSEEYDWLIDYLVDGVTRLSDDETQGDALLTLSAMDGLGSSAKRLSYVKALIYCLTSRSSRIRYAALRAISDASKELASITSGSMPQGVDATLLDEFSRALFTAIHLDHNSTMQYDNHLVHRRNHGYLRLILALVKNNEWCDRLTRDGHMEWCISLYEKVLTSSLTLDKFYLAEILLRIDPASKDISLNPSQGKRWTLIKTLWTLRYLDVDWLEELPTFITATRQHLLDPNNDVTKAELVALATDVHEVSDVLMWRQENRHWHGDSLMTLVDAALPTVQAFYGDLLSYAEHGDISQVNNGLVGS